MRTPKELALRASSVAVIGLLLAFSPGCASKAGTAKTDKVTQELLTQPKEVLFEKGKNLLAKKKYDQARKYLNHVFETYPNEQMGREALLLVADSYFAEKSTTGYTEARYRYRDYLNRYPGAPRRDYARYQFALCYDKEHEKPDRDQTATREAIEQYRSLIREFPDSGYAGAARERVRQLTDLLAEHDFAIGYFYLRKGSTAAALSRFTSLEERFPDYGARDKLYYYEGIALTRLGRKDEAGRYFQKVVQDFPKSDYAKKARSKAGPLPAATPAPEAAAVDTKAGNQ
jgi:outer membrane protein assembly factor BamD